MKGVFLIFVALSALSCAEKDPILCWCTGEGTQALVMNQSEYFYKSEGWDQTDHPLCEGKPKGSIVFKDQQPLMREPNKFSITMEFADVVLPGEFYLAEDLTVWERDESGWMQRTTRQKDRVWVRDKWHRHDPSEDIGTDVWSTKETK